MARHFVTLVFAVLPLAIVGCGGDDDDDDDDDSTIGCQDDPNADTYVANLSKPGDAGAFTFVLVSSEPAPPGKGDNTWIVRVTDPGGAPVPGATLGVSPFMPEHGHGSNVEPVVAPNGGDFTITTLRLFMTGLWEVTLDAEAEDTSDSAVFRFCIQG